ncbi:MAG: glycosyltransferase family 87 protein [Sphaerobacter sp.]|nr:glycosyltransferase family 87 protein [Sphaerobacter sp.]
MARRPSGLTAGARTAIVVGGALLLGVQAVMALGSRITHGLFGHVGMDFLTTYTAARILARGEGADLYNWWTQYAVQHPILAAHGVSWSDRILQPYVAPPLLGLLALPLQVLPAGGALLLWVVLSVAGLVLAGRLLDRALDLRLGRLCPLLVLSFFPAYYTLLLGQSEALLVLGVVAFVLLSRRQADLLAGVALGVLVLKPPLLVVPVIYLVTKQRWRALAGLSLACVLAAALSLAALGPGGVADYLRLSRELSQPEGTIATNVAGMINIRGALIRLLPGAPALLQQFGIAGLSLTLLTVCVAAWRRTGAERGTPAEEAELALMLLATCLVSYHALIHTGVLILPAVALLWRGMARTTAAGDRERGVLLGLLVAIWVAPTVLYLPSGTSILPAAVFTPLLFGLWLVAAEVVIRQTAAEPALVKVRTPPGERRW